MTKEIQHDGMILPFSLIKSMNRILEEFENDDSGRIGSYDFSALAIRETVRGFALTFSFERRD